MEVTRIFGSPGTGKTTKLLNIYGEELAKGVKPEEIAFVTFTRKGIAEGKSRVMKRYGVSHEQVKYFKTLHSLAFSLGGHSREEVLDEDSLEKINYILGTNITGKDKKTRGFEITDDMYVDALSIQRNNESVKTSDEKKASYDNRKAAIIAKHFETAKKAVGKLDFTDLIEEMANGESVAPVKVAFVDEAQDLTPLQWKAVRRVFADVDRIYVAGDDDQALYHWNGASVEDFLGIKAVDIVLEKSYRLPKNIWEVANRIAKGISVRKDKIYSPVSDGGEVWEIRSLGEIPLDNKEEWLILARDNNRLIDIRKFLTTNLIHYSEDGRSWTGKKMSALIELFEDIRRSGRAATEEEKAKFEKHIDGEVRFDEFWARVFNWRPYKKEFFLAHFLKHGTYTPEESQVEIGTFHSAKGGEADNVVVLMDHTKIVAEEKMENADNEMRCLYVASTRAKKRLFYLDLGGRHSYREDLEKLKIQVERYKNGN